MTFFSLLFVSLAFAHLPPAFDVEQDIRALNADYPGLALEAVGGNIPELAAELELLRQNLQDETPLPPLYQLACTKPACVGCNPVICGTGGILR